MKKLLYIICLLLGVAAAGAQGEYSREELLQWRPPIHPRNTSGILSPTNVSLMLPLKDAKGNADMRFVEFYRGAVLAAKELRENGHSLNIEVFDTPRNEAAVDAIVSSPEFAQTNVVIGLIYPEGMAHVLDFCERQAIPLVSPMSFYEEPTNHTLFQMAPVPARRYSKLLELLSQPDVNVVYVATSKPDPDMERDLRPLLTGASTINYSTATRGATFQSQGDRSARENIFVVSCTDPHIVDGILSKISSVRTNLVARGMTKSDLRVVGAADWAWFPAAMIDRELYFKVGVCWVSNYHVDRTNERVRRLDGRYIAAYGDLPPSAPIVRPGAREVRVRPYFYRGYDAVMLFAGTGGTDQGDYIERLNALGADLLQVRYDFHRAPMGDWRNENWPLVCYRPDYSIVVE